MKHLKIYFDKKNLNLQTEGEGIYRMVDIFILISFIC